MFSVNSFTDIAKRYGFTILGYEYAGNNWKKAFKYLKDDSQSDLRICMQKIKNN